ncbi:MAG: helix-turn-helix transcriptional regulator [Microcella sp.]|uniref:ArsR/SmtB family transcription factor n=1 Tax=Microcella sp. TaxID=1913979 RepID=UPI0024C8712C|nr:helix-turn-helix domain-containing protein [Microcella sp.]UYN83141.1 MAG: helix-turn-helix transcriptional regulator [Microcella sp.]
MAPDQIFRALGDPVRLAIVGMLLDRDGQALFEICTRLIAHGMSITRQGVAKHIAVLVDAGVVRAERDGRTTRHHLELDALATARRWFEPLPAPNPSRPTQETS